MSDRYTGWIPGGAKPDDHNLFNLFLHGEKREPMKKYYK